MLDQQKLRHRFVAELQIHSQRCTTVCWIGKNQQKLRHRFVAVWYLQPEVYHSMLDGKESTEAPSQICGCVVSTTRSVPQYAGLERINRSSVTDLWLCGIYNRKCTTVCGIDAMPSDTRRCVLGRLSTVGNVRRCWISSNKAARSVPLCVG